MNNSTDNSKNATNEIILDEDTRVVQENKIGGLEAKYERFMIQARRFTYYYRREMMEAFRYVFDPENDGIPTVITDEVDFLERELVELLTASYIVFDLDECVNIKTISKCIKEQFDSSYSDADLRKKLKVIDTLVVSLKEPEFEDSKPVVGKIGYSSLMFGAFANAGFSRYWETHYPRTNSPHEKVVRFTWIIRKYF